MESIEQKIKRISGESFSIEEYNPEYPGLFLREKQYLLAILPDLLVKRIEHFGSTAIPNMTGKPIIDMLVEVSSLEKTKEVIVPILEAKGYDYLWRPSWGDDTPPFYAWFIKRNSSGERTHHIHMVEKSFEHWDRLLFRDYLIEHANVAKEYANLKNKLFSAGNSDRVEYTQKKGDFIKAVTETAIRYYSNVEK